MTESGCNELVAIRADLCTCRLCQGALRHPIILACYHTFCSDCLQQYISLQASPSGQRSFPCPVCSLATSCPEDTNSGQWSGAGKLDTFASRLSEVLEAFKDDKKCDICLGADMQFLASDWCMDCYEALCDKCRKVHLCGKITRDHVVVAMSEIRQMSLESLMSGNSSQKCGQHGEEVVKFYCLDCGLPVCVQCLAAAHRRCRRCVPVSDARHLIKDDLTQILAQLHRMTADSSCPDSSRLAGSDSINDSIHQAETAIRSLADELRTMVSQLETDLLDKLRLIDLQLQDKNGYTVEPREEEVNMLTLTSAKMLTSAQTRLTAVLKYGSDVEILDLYHNVKDTISRLSGEALPSSPNVPARLKVTFDIDDKVKAFRRDLEKLGDIRVEDSTLDQGFSAWGVAVTARDEIIVVDCRNKRVQKFLTSGLLIDHIQLSEEPRDLTSFGPSDVALTVSRRQILILDVTGKLELKRRVDTQKQYDGIAFTSSFYSFLVSCLEDRCIDLISPKGEIMRTCKVSTETMEPIFGAPRYVAVTRDGQCLVSDTVHNAVTCISPDGALLFTYAPSENGQAITKAQGVCCDKNGNIFVADYGHARIHLLTSEGNFQRFILGRDSDLCRPVALAMTQTNKLVVVQSDGIVKIFSYEGNKTQNGSQDTDNGKQGQGRPRVHSSTSSRVNGLGGRRFSESSGAASSVSSLSAHTFRSRHF